MRTALLLGALCFGLGLARAQTGTTVFEGARIIVGDGTVLECAAFAVKDGKIESVAASILGLDDLGSLSPGKSADFIVLDANPLEDIANTTRIVQFFRKGQAIDREALRTSWMR